MQILSVGTALPTHRFQQSELVDLLGAVWQDSALARKHLPKLHKSVRVSERYLALPKERYGRMEDFTEANAAFIEIGTDLGEEALVKAIAAAGLVMDDIDAFFFTTVTGIGVPTIDARLINRLRLRPDVKRTPLFGLGCLAGAAGLSRMHDYLEAYPDHVAVLLSVELCSLTLQKDDVSVANLIASGLFGDGAAAVVGCGSKRAARSPVSPRLAVEATKSSFYYDTEDVMGWEIGASGFKIILSAAVPMMVKNHLVADMTDFLKVWGMGIKDVSTWICHPGGPKVLEAMEEGFAFRSGELAVTWKSLNEVGNLSSASVLFVLADTLAKHPRPASSPAVMTAMGPGFCSEILLLRWL